MPSADASLGDDHLDCALWRGEDGGIHQRVTVNNEQVGGGANGDPSKVRSANEVRVDRRG